MYDTVNSAFADALKREGRVITSYLDNTPYNVLFRRNSDRNKLQDTTTIYYSADSGVRCGQLLKYKDKTYLTINQESAENDTYLKSDMFQTNAMLNFISGGMEFSVPAYAYDINNALALSNNTLSIVNGNIQLIAENNSTTRALNINDFFYALGGYWQINYLIYKDDVIYIYVTREATSVTYAVTITANDSYDRGTTAQFTATATAKDTEIINANIVWTSSDTSKATVDANGLVTFIADGSVTISAVWQEHSATGSKTITISEPPVYGLTINGEDSYLTTDTPTLTATATINGTTDNAATITWTSSDVSKATIDAAGTITFLDEGVVTITATWTEHDITATKDISVTIPVPTTQYTCKITNTLASWTEYNDTTNIIPIKVGGSLKPIMCHFYNSAGTEVTDQTPVWSINVSSLPTEQQSKVHLTYNASYPLRCYLNADDINTLIGLRFTISLTNSTGTCEMRTVPVQITSYT